MGGQGAPLAPFFHLACARFIGATAPLAMLNLGGVGNVTWIDPRWPSRRAPGALLAFDTGPANAPVNDLMQARRGSGAGRGRGVGATGRVDEAILARVSGACPISTRCRQNRWTAMTSTPFLRPCRALSDADAAATLTACAAAAVARGAEHFPGPDHAGLLVTGGGRHNAALMAELAARVPAKVEPVEAVGLDGDMLEAQAFAYLAVRVLRGMPTSAPMTTGVPAAVGGGRISRVRAAIGLG